MYDTKHYDDAIRLLSKIADIKSQRCPSLYMAGMTFQKKGEKEKGQKICDKAIEMDPSLARHRQKKENANRFVIIVS